MSRLLKFRAWNGKAMEYGGFCIHATGTLIKDSALGDVFSESPVMQFTGLHDMNTFELYEGDLIKNESGRVAVITWHSFQAQWDCDYVLGGGTEHGFPTSLWHDHVEKIGDKYSNPELLERS